jgi:Ca-activated chloride channel family protein
MTRSFRAARAISWGFILPFAIQLPAPQNFKFQKGQSVYVVAVRGGPFSACWANRKTPVRPNEFYAPELLPNEGEPIAGALPDPDLKSRIEKEFQREKYFKLADSVDNADFVFFVAADRAASASAEKPGTRESILAEETDRQARDQKPGTNRPVVPAGEPAIAGFGIGGYFPDEQPNAIASVAASAVPSGLYKKYQADAASIFQAGAWKGIDTALTYPSTKLSASPEALVAELRSGKKIQGQWTICIAPQPPRAQAAVENRDARTNPKTGVVAPALPNSQSGAAATAPSIKIDVTLVTVPVIVSDSSGRYVPDLQASDFHVYENDVEQKIDRLITENQPFNVSLMLDTSSSMSFDIQALQKAALAFVDLLRLEDRIMIVSFNDRVVVDSELTNNRSLLRPRILGIANGQGTRLYDAIDLVLTDRLNTISERKAIVLFTDGVDTRSRLTSPMTTVADVEESQALVYVVQYDTEAQNRPIQPRSGQSPRMLARGAVDNVDVYRVADQFVQELSDVSGGRLYQAQTAQGLESAFSQIATELSRQYMLCYYPTNQSRDESFHRIRVEVSRPGVKIRARSGYRVAVERTTGRRDRRA